MKFPTSSTLVLISCLLLLLSSLFLQEVNSKQCQSMDYPTTIYNNTEGYITSKSQVFPVGVSASIGDGFQYAVMMLSMIADIFNNQTDILPDVRIEIYVSDVFYSDSNTLSSTQSFIQNNKIRALINGYQLAETKVAQLVCRINGIPQVTPTVISNDLSNRNEYPLLARVIPNELVHAKAIAEFLRHNKWTQVLLIYSDDSSGVSGLEQLKFATEDLNITIHSLQIRAGYTNATVYLDAIQSLVDKYRLRVFIHYMQIADASPLAVALTNVGLMGTAKYAHIFSHNLAIEITTNADLYPWAVGSVGFAPREGNGPVYEEFLQVWQTKSEQPGWKPDPRIAWYLGDSLLAIIHSLDKAMKTTGFRVDKINSTTHMDAFKYLTFDGITGNVTFDSIYERRGDFNIINFGDNNTQSFTQPIGYFSDLTHNLTLYNTITWAQGATLVGDGVCVCHFGTCNDADMCVCNPGFTGVTCSDQTKDDKFGTRLITITVLLPTFTIVIMAIATSRYVSYKRARAIKDVADRQKSSIKRADITINNAVGRGASGTVFRAMFRGTEVAVKRIMTEDVSKNALEEFELESAVMAGLRHPNIVLFMGSCLVPEEKEMLLVMEFMERGSLHDVLHNSRIDFTFEMALHIASQAAKGMNFLHQSSPPIIHRDLKSHNILLDDKWNARIADFGITKMKDITSTSKSRSKEKSVGTIFWTAPEVFQGYINTEKSDCYSFGIVLWELAHRQNPYEGRDPMAVAMDVSRNSMRPPITAKILPEYEELMRNCWDQDPEKRPTFEEVTQKLKQMSMKHPVAVHSSYNSKAVQPPSGMGYFVRTQVDAGNTLWDKYPNDMLAAMETHNRLLRTNMDNYEGYEASFEEDGFLVAFEELTNAMDFCIAFQVSLLHVEWPHNFSSTPITSKILSSDGSVIWNGLCVRMSLHFGVPNSSIDLTTGRTIFFGPIIDKLKTLLDTAPSSASIVTSAAIIEQIDTKALKLAEKIVYKSCGQLSDTSKSKTESLYDVLPVSLEARSTTCSKPTCLPYAVLDVVEVEIAGEPSPSSSHKQEELSWMVKFEELAIRQNVGKGAIGDYYRGLWNGKEVAIKALVNQKLDESDILQLKARAATLSKIKHKNLVEVFGVCFEPGHISLITEFMPNSGLHQIISNTSVSLPWATRLNIAKQIAEGMAHLATIEDPAINIHANLKSENVLVNLEFGVVKVNDFGQGSLKDLARTMTSVGTVAWTAPEILSGEEPSAAVSVYSFGIILHELLTRKMPYPDEHPVKLVSMVVQGHRPAIPADCPPEYKQLMVECWGADPAKRPTWPYIADKLADIIVSTK